MKQLFFLLIPTLALAQLQVTGTRLENVDYPYPVQYLELEIQGQKLEMAYMDVPPKTPNGKTVLLLHGKNFQGNYWEQTAKDLAGQGYRVVIPDQVGFGKSTKTDAIQYSFQLLAENTKKLLDKLGVSKTSVVGHSMGGMLATRFALMFPQTAEKLVLENPLGLEDWKTLVPYQNVDAWYESELKLTYDKMKAYQLKFYYNGKWKPEYDKWLNIQAGWLKSKEYPLIARNSALTYDMIFTQPVCYEFANLQMPVLLIIGQLDRTALGKDRAPADVRETLGDYPRMGKATAAKIKNAKLVELEGIGHSPHIEKYDAFLKPLLDFLGK